MLFFRRWLGIIAIAAIAVCAALTSPAADRTATKPAKSDATELLHAGEGQARRFDPTDAYELRKIRGWVVRVNKRLIDERPGLAGRAIELLDFQLYQITRAVPAPAVEKISKVPIWIEQEDPLVLCMCYHPSRDWVVDHGLNPDKTHSVEIGSAQRFLDWEKTQPWMVLHELAHAYHDQFLPDGFENADIRTAYESARDQKLYDPVLRENGHHERAYAMTNQMEYFAECSEAFFGSNDFYPFVRAEFEEHDPKGYEAVRRAWGFGEPKSATQRSAAPGTNPN